jgi:peptidoglycan/LPS O-acetylase OafA/YrhL
MATGDARFAPRHRFAVLDGWRGIAALGVAIYHFDAYSHVIASPFVHGAYLFVDFFFVLSGFVITYTYGDRLTRWGDIVEFAVRRFGRLWPLHVATLSFLFALELLKLYAAGHGWIHFNRPPFDPAGADNWGSVATNLVLIQSFGLHPGATWNLPSWSICVEFWTYLVFAALAWSGRRSLAIGALACIATGFLVVTFAGKDMNVAYDYGFFRCIFGFFTGYFVLRLWRARARQWARWIGFLEIPALVAVALFVVHAADNFGSVFAPLLFGPVVLIFACERGLVSRAMQARPIEWIGAWSYSIYMVHSGITDVIFLAVSAIEKVGHVTLRGHFPAIADAPLLAVAGNPYIGDALVPVYVVAVLGVSALTYRLIEKPGRAFFNHLAVRHRLQPAE